MSSASAEHHYGDEILVAYLDRELSECERERIDHHLGECWSCRTRAAEIEQGIHMVTQAIEEESSRSGDEIRRALHDFFRRRMEFESRRRSPLLATCALPWSSWRPIPVALAGLTVLVIVIAAIWFRGPREPLPEVVVAQAKASEDTLRRSRRPAHQILHVEGRISSERVARDFGTLEIWSDSAAGGRYSSSWMDARKILRHAVWQPAAATR
jgi:anti-sigma factor RsiW